MLHSRREMLLLKPRALRGTPSIPWRTSASQGPVHISSLRTGFSAACPRVLCQAGDRQCP